MIPLNAATFPQNKVAPFLRITVYIRWKKGVDFFSFPGIFLLTQPSPHTGRVVNKEDYRGVADHRTDSPFIVTEELHHPDCKAKQSACFYTTTAISTSNQTLRFLIMAKRKMLHSLLLFLLHVQT